jgi:hypothetical protein
MTEYVLRTGKALLCAARDNAVDDSGQGDRSHRDASLDWLGIPLKVGDATVRCSRFRLLREHKGMARPINVLTFVSQHIGSALHRKSDEDALRRSEKCTGRFSKASKTVTTKWISKATCLLQ